MVGYTPSDTEGAGLLVIAAGILGAEVCGVLKKHGVILRKPSPLATLSPERKAEIAENSRLVEKHVTDARAHLIEYIRNREQNNLG